MSLRHPFVVFAQQRLETFRNKVNNEVVIYSNIAFSSLYAQGLVYKFGLSHTSTIYLSDLCTLWCVILLLVEFIFIGVESQDLVG